MAGVVTMGILLSGEELGGRDAAHRNQRSDAARKQKPHRRCAVARRGILAAPFPLDGGVNARLRVPETARMPLRAIPTPALYAFTA
jgi:hypothetical protein